MSRKSNPFNFPSLSPAGTVIRLVDGVFQVYENQTAADLNKPKFAHLDRSVYLRDFATIYRLLIDGPLWVDTEVQWLDDNSINSCFFSLGSHFASGS